MRIVPTQKLSRNSFIKSVNTPESVVDQTGGAHNAGQYITLVMALRIFSLTTLQNYSISLNSRYCLLVNPSDPLNSLISRR